MHPPAFSHYGQVTKVKASIGNVRRLPTDYWVVFLLSTTRQLICTRIFNLSSIWQTERIQNQLKVSNTLRSVIYLNHTWWMSPFSKTWLV